ncbi:MAG: virulence RhuM family protein [Flavobacterium sp.]|nr:virulence RhuM family protein [Flavobacterium sp.]
MCNIKSIYIEEELNQESTIKDCRSSKKELVVFNVHKMYNLDVIISIGYRVKSKQGTHPSMGNATKIIW